MSESETKRNTEGYPLCEFCNREAVVFDTAIKKYVCKVHRPGQQQDARTTALLRLYQVIDRDKLKPATVGALEIASPEAIDQIREQIEAKIDAAMKRTIQNLRRDPNAAR